MGARVKKHFTVSYRHIFLCALLLVLYVFGFAALYFAPRADSRDFVLIYPFGTSFTEAFSQSVDMGLEVIRTGVFPNIVIARLGEHMPLDEFKKNSNVTVLRSYFSEACVSFNKNTSGVSLSANNRQ